MEGYVEQSLYVYCDDNALLVEPIGNNPFEVAIAPLQFTTFMDNDGAFYDTLEHVIFNGTLQESKSVLRQAMDLMLCNDEILMFKAAIGRLPLIDSPHTLSPFKLAAQAFKRSIGLRLLLFYLTASWNGRSSSTRSRTDT